MPWMILALFLAVSGASTVVEARGEDPLLPGGLLAEGTQPPRGLPPTLSPRSKELLMTPSDAARQVQRRHGGRVLSVQGSGPGYRVKVLKDGEVRIFEVNP